MKPVQILMDEELLAEVDKEARRVRSDRSKLVRAALVRHLKELQQARLEREHIEGYRKRPVRKKDMKAWERIQQWPGD
jgi:metal-responsive CopG/Arc/MetJ family transcriptional regulator